MKSQVQSPISSSETFTLRLEVIAKGIKPETSNKMCGRKTINSGNIVVVKDKLLVFPKTKVHRQEFIKLQMNNKDNMEHVVMVTSPELPFIVKHSKVTLMPRRYIRLPICYEPQAPGFHTATVSFSVDTGDSFSVQLKGQAC